MKSSPLFISALVAFTVLLISCSSKGIVDRAVSGPPRSETKKLLEQGEAEKRKFQVKRVDYKLSFKLDKESEEFQGEVEIDFDLNHTFSDLTVDFLDGTVKSVEVNGLLASPPIYNGIFINLPKETLRKGKNIVKIGFDHKYSNTGSGLHRFKDPEDGRVYMYTDFEPYDANQLFPCFDQPDLRATYEVEVTAPSEWIVVTSVREKKIRKSGSKNITWTFPRSKNFSTYIFSLHAGPYKVWKSRAGKVPMRLMARRSVAKYVTPRDWFVVTRQGFRFFNKYFDYKYPFKKYDQLIVPDFNAGAMENVAAVTFSERYIHRSKPSQAQRERRANVILHELAHMWFGNLVTMKWWNGLWLNESFASYMAALALNRATEFKRSWHTFYTGMKQWAYWEDQLVTTHPIEVPVGDTSKAFAVFDGITYGKGASVLKQLSFYIGKKNFRNGIRDYFKTHAFGNTELKDFIGALEKSSKKDLSVWTKQWLNQESLNTVKADYACKAGRISKFNLLQTAPSDHDYLRAHRTNVGLYALDEVGKLVVQKVMPVSYQASKTEVADLIGEDCPVMVYPNHGDEDFVKVELDEQSLQKVRVLISRVKDPLLRGMFWQTLWDMVRDAKWPIIDYADLVMNEIGAEKDIKVKKAVLERMFGRRSADPANVVAYLPQTGQKGSEIGKKYFPVIEDFLWLNLMRSRPRSDTQKLYFDGYIRAATTTNAIKKIHHLLKGTVQVKGMKVDQDRRWALIRKLSAANYQGVDKIIEKELKRDPSDKGQKMALAARAATPDLSTKKKWYKEFSDNQSKIPLSKLKVAMWNLFPRNQKTFKQSFHQEFFTSLPKLAKTKDGEFLESYSMALAPTLCTEKSVDQLGDYIDDHEDLPPTVVRNLKVSQQEDDRCTKIKAVMINSFTNG